MAEGEPQSQAPDASATTSGSLLSAGKDGPRLGPKSGVWEGGILGGEDAAAPSERQVEDGVLWRAKLVASWTGTGGATRG